MSSTAPHIRIGTRGSDLALWQAHHVRDLLQARGATVEIVVLKTRGDQIQNVSFDKMEGKGFFTKEIEQALLDGDVDLAVHSHKDLETTPPAGLVVAAVPPRGPVEDVVLVRPESVDLTTPFHVQRGGVVGTSSMRRKNQLELGQPDLRIEALRGNVPTRIQKLRDGQYDAIMLAHAGVHRLELDLTDLHVHVLDPLNFVPAPAQGALALQMREGDPLLPFVEALTDPDTVHAIGLERSILRELEGGCQLPFGAYVPGGTRNVYTYLGEARGPLRQAWLDVSASDATEGPFLQDLTSPAPWPSAFITQDLAPDAPLRALFATRGADLQGASCIEVRPSGEAVPGTPAEGDWLFLGSPKCAALFASHTRRVPLPHRHHGRGHAPSVALWHPHCLDRQRQSGRGVQGIGQRGRRRDGLDSPRQPHHATLGRAPVSGQALAFYDVEAPPSGGGVGPVTTTDKTMRQAAPL